MVKIINPKVFDLEIKKLDLKEKKITGIFNNEIITNIKNIELDECIFNKEVSIHCKM